MNASLLIIDDDSSITTMLYENFRGRYDVYIAGGGREGIEKFVKNTPEAVILDMRMPDMNGMEVLKKIKETSPATPVIMLTAFGDIETAVQAIKLGADQFLTKPVDLTALDSMIAKATEYIRVKEGYHFLQEKLGHLRGELILDPKTMTAVNIMVANPNTTVLITGPTGTGKGVIAELIHNKSVKDNALFVDINCAGLSESLLESELFGHEQGAFTGAKAMKKGLMEIADGGTLFLDEIGNMPLSIQAKILKAIETHTFRRIGGTATIRVKVRIIAATNIDLVEMVRKNLFREDLYYRLNVLPIRLPPLKEKREMIPELAMLFIKRFASGMNKPVQGITDDALSLLCNHFWAGNIRELQNVIERAAILCKGAHITCQHLPLESHKKESKEIREDNLRAMTLEELEKRQITFTLNLTNHNKKSTARLLGINPSTLWRKIKSYGIPTD